MSHNKYSDLHSLHERIRSAENDYPEQIISNIQIVGQKEPDAINDPFFSKSSAQVATYVGQNVPHKSCERRSKGVKHPAKPTKYPSPLRVRYPTYEDRDKVFETAKQAGYKSVSAYLRDVSLEPYKVLAPPTDPELTKALLALNKELTSQGNNLNQLAKQMNGGKASPAEADGALGVLARSMLGTHRAIRQALSYGKEQEP
jgi:hypothetical protein